jgi:hypothetical protein
MAVPGGFSTILPLVVQPVIKKRYQNSHCQRSQYQLHDALEQAIYTSFRKAALVFYHNVNKQKRPVRILTTLVF